MDAKAWTLLQQLWRCHQHNPINTFECTSSNGGALISHPATCQQFTVDPELVWPLQDAGLIRGRTTLSLTYLGIFECEGRFGSGVPE